MLFPKIGQKELHVHISALDSVIFKHVKQFLNPQNI